MRTRLGESFHRREERILSGDGFNPDFRALRELGSPAAGHWLRARVGPETLIVQNLCGWEGRDANLWRQIDTQAFGLYGFAKADEQTTLPTDKVPVNIKNIQLLREAYHSV